MISEEEAATTSAPNDTSRHFRFVPTDRSERERVIHDEKYTDGSPDELTFLHIGKCGGYSVADALAASPNIQSRFKSIKRVHLRPPHYQSNARYLLVLRNPIDRLVSAFSWRYQEVVQGKGANEFKYAGEFEALSRYENLNNLAERLIIDGILSVETIKYMLDILHFRQDISYYIEDIVAKATPGQIYGVFTQDRLAEDIKEVLGVDSATHRNRSQLALFEKNSVLSDVARRNLKTVFARDYECIKSLNAIYPLGAERMNALLQ